MNRISAVRGGGGISSARFELEGDQANEKQKRKGRVVLAAILQRLHRCIAITWEPHLGPDHSDYVYRLA